MDNKDNKNLNVVKTPSSSSNFTQKKKKESEDLIVNLKYDEDPSYIKYQSSKRKSSLTYYENVDILDQSRFKFILNPITQESIEKYNRYTNIREIILWTDIFKIIYYSNEVYNCPICLEIDLLVPHISRCGHIFCYPCIIQYLNASTQSLLKDKNSKNPKCPLCKGIVKIEELKFCEVKNFFQLKAGEFFSASLIMKEKSYPTLFNVSYDSSLENFNKRYTDLRFLPYESEEAFTFSRIFISEDIQPIYEKIKTKFDIALNEEILGFADRGRIEALKQSSDFITVKISSVKGLPTEKLVIKKEILTPGVNTESTFSFFYQAENSDIYFLHPINHSMIISEFGDINKLPTHIYGKILEIELHQMTPMAQQKYPFLNHLKLGNLFYIVEMDMTNIVSGHVLKDFYKTLKNRSIYRESIKNEEKHYDDYINKIKETEQNKLKKKYQTFSYHDSFNKLDPKISEESIIVTKVDFTETEGKDNMLKKLFEGEFKKEEVKIEPPNEIVKFQFVQEEFPDLNISKADNSVKSSNKHNKRQKPKFQDLNIDIFKKNTIETTGNINETAKKQIKEEETKKIPKKFENVSSKTNKK